jgi:hypothetical protein
MDVRFENRYRMTRQRFLDMAAHPVRKPSLPLAWILLLVLSLSVAFYSATASDALGAGAFLVLAAGCAFRIFFYAPFRAAGRFRSLARVQGAQEWERVIRFTEDGIAAQDGVVEAAYGWDRVAELKAVPGYLVLLLKGPELIRLDRSGFTAGAAEEFVSYVRSAHPEIRTTLS